MFAAAIRIRLAYRQVIDANSTGEFEKAVFNDSYQEFLVQAQGYNTSGEFTTLQEMISANPKAASLHYKVAFSVSHHINGLNGFIPGLYDSFEGLPVPFTRHRFTVLQSNIVDYALHKVMVTYIKDDVHLYGLLQDELLVSFDEEPKEGNSGYLDTFSLKLQPNLSIIGINKS